MAIEEEPWFNTDDFGYGSHFRTQALRNKGKDCSTNRPGVNEQFRLQTFNFFNL